MDHEPPSASSSSSSSTSASSSSSSSYNAPPQASTTHDLSNESVAYPMDDSSSQDDDSEPILGLLFREPKQHCQNDSDKQSQQQPNTSGVKKQRTQSSSSGSTTIDNSIKFSSLATILLNYINNTFTHDDHNTKLSLILNQYPIEKQLKIVAEIIKSLDKNSTDTESYANLSHAITTLTQNMLSIKSSPSASTTSQDESDNEPERANKFLGLMYVAETVLNITLNRTAANIQSDSVKLNFMDFCTTLISLANLDHSRNHVLFLPYAIKWLKLCRKYLNDNQIFAQNSIDLQCETTKTILNATCSLLEYISNILELLNFISAISSSVATDLDSQDFQGNPQSTDWVDEGPCFNVGDDDDESLVDDSDDESLCNKLCTFTITQKEFVNQHWYQCHTCNMVDKVGVCSVCAKVCHKDHDLSYAKYGAFFCDCAERENGTCIALVKRAPLSTSGKLDNSMIQPIVADKVTTSTESKQDFVDATLAGKSTSSISSSTNSKDQNIDLMKKNNSLHHNQTAKQLEPIKNELLNIISQSDISITVMNLLSSFIPAYVNFAKNESHIGRSKRARAALEELHNSKKKTFMTEALMLPTLGSQEGAFENVRVNYSGEHSTWIKQLLSNNTLKRVVMTSLSSPLGKRQHLVVCHEKGKITLLQLSALLSQADSSKRKLTLTRLASAPIPFSVISIVANPFNEDVLAVSGLKDCHILTFTNNGIVSSHIELQLDSSSSSDYIIKAVWIPGGQTELAILTSEVVKIYDLSENSFKPKYHLHLANFGNLKDISFVVSESNKSSRYILMMDTSGHIYQQELESSVSSLYGLCYVSSELPISHSSIKEVDGRLNGGGVSLYYSHSFKMLFFSFANGNYMASLPTPTEVKRVFPLEFQLTNLPYSQSSSIQATYASVVADNNDESSTSSQAEQIPTPPKSSTKTVTTHAKMNQPLCQWSEVSGHVGLVMAVSQNSNNPVIIMLGPDRVFAQEILCLSNKSRIMDATAIRHTTSSGEVRTTLILLCEDGSLRIYMASTDLTDHWLKLSMNPTTAIGSGSYSFFAKTSNNKRRRMSGKSSKKPSASKTSSSSNATHSFPVDFFENLTLMDDIDFGGPDVLSIYSSQQVKTRLNSPDTHLVCTKSTGFAIEVINNDPNMVICGVRVQVGSQDLTRCPSSIEIFGRNTVINPLTPRWYDIPLTRDESLQDEKRLSIVFGTSSDQNCITVVDSIKVYGKTKESFSWPDECEDSKSANGVLSDDLLSVLLGQETGALYQNLLLHSIESLECCLNLCRGQSNLNRTQQESLARELSTSILTVPYSSQVLKTMKSLLLTIYSTKQNYNEHRDSAALSFVMSSLASFKEDNIIDGELFSRVVFIMKSLCQSKPSSLIKLSDCLDEIVTTDHDNVLNTDGIKPKQASNCSRLITYLRDLFWHLYQRKPSNSSLASIASSGYTNYEDILQPLIELIYTATLLDLTILTDATDVIIEFLLSEDLNITLCVRHTLIRLLRNKGTEQQQQQQRSLLTDTKQSNLILLERLIEHLPDTRSAGGFRSISLLHVILVLTLDLDCDNEVDDAILKNLLQSLRQELLWNTEQSDLLLLRNPTNEVKLVIMRMFSILMSKVRTSSVASAVSSSTRAETDSCWSTFCSSITALSLIESNVMEFCYNVLKHSVLYWSELSQSSPTYQSSSHPMFASLASENLAQVNRITLPKSSAYALAPDLSPFFLRQTRGHSVDLFEDYIQLLTEMVLKIPYQIKKVSCSSSNNLKSVTFSADWSVLLCDYLMIAQIPPNIKKNVRKLLTCICGSKEKYRQLRDFHFLDSHIRSVKTICGYSPIVTHTDSSRANQIDDDTDDDLKSITMNYESMTTFVEHLKSCIDIAQNRCINWQIYCLLKDHSLLSFLTKISLKFDDKVCPIILELLQHALSSSTALQSTLQEQQPSNQFDSPSISQAATSEHALDDQTLRDTLTSESLSANLSQQLITTISDDLLSRFAQRFLLETNVTSLRWQAHSLFYNLWSNFLPRQQHHMVLVLWSLWNNLPKYGRKAAQFVDLIGFVTLKSPPTKDSYDTMFCQETLNVLKQQNQLLIHHPNAHIYNSIQGLVDLDCFYLESEPCSVCNSPEIPYSSIKLSSIKMDSRFTTTTQIIKLIGSHTILKFSLRISDIKRNKMVKTLSVYYNNRSVQSVVDLKNKNGIWNLARKYSLSPEQPDVKIEFTLPIVACNLMIEFAEFYDNIQASSETLQCPRCSTSVSANPGVCGNCGENVFQCHKCRAINYDEKDPFLCISCGFCKYARFDISLTAKPTCAVDPIENEEDRKKTVASISSMLENADRAYKNLIQNKPTLELLLLRIHEQVIPDRYLDDMVSSSDHQNIASGLAHSSGPGAVQPGQSLQAQSIIAGYGPSLQALNSGMTSSVNKAIQQLAQKYCVECKTFFEELSKITHRILASRRELVEYDNKQLGRCLSAGSSVLTSANRRKSRVYSSLSSGSGKCYGCATATVEHCITMLKALSTVPKLRAQIRQSGIITEIVSFNLRNASNTISHEVRQLLCLLTRDDLASTTSLTNILIDKVGAIGKQDYQPMEISHIVKHEIALLSVTLDSDDQCWELRLKCLIRIFAHAFQLNNPIVMECLVIPCLKLLLSIIRPPSPTTRRHKDKSLDSIASVRTDNYKSSVLLLDWLTDSKFVFDDWRRTSARPSSTLTTAAQSSKQMKPITSILRRTSRVYSRTNYLAEKYGNRWRFKCSKFTKTAQPKPIATLPNDWLKRLLFNPASKTVRLMAKSLVEALFTVPSRKQEIVDLLTSYLNEIGPAGECAQEFYHLYKNIITTDYWHYYLALRGTLMHISDLITIEIDKLQELEESTLNSSLALGYSLKMLLELFTSFVAVPQIRSHYKAKLVGFVLKGYLSLRKLIVQRTKTIDETQEMLLELLESMTTGSETETANFIQVCVDAIRKCHEGDIRTPVFIFERLCSTIHPEESYQNEFFVSLEKDPQQEDYLQGRMLGNPYSSSETGIGPLMKDIKNKICQDCELLALLEDDSSMELLVSNKIISLDLPVREVYKRLWCPENHEGDAMRIVYRMRGLLGDATEEFIESFDSRNNEAIDEEQVYKMANIMSGTGGLEVMLNRLRQIDDLSPPFKPLLSVILKLFNYCTKTAQNRIKLLSPDLKSVETLLNTLRLALNESEFLQFVGLTKQSLGEKCNLPTSAIASKPAPVSAATNEKTQTIDQILSILETVLKEASQLPRPVFEQFCSETCGSVSDVQFLLNSAMSLCTRLPNVSHKLLQVVPYLTLGHHDKMSVLVDYFKPSLDFVKFDEQHSAANESNIDLFCIMVNSIERNENGNQLKDFIVTEKIVADSLKYLTRHAPPLKSSLLAKSDDWKTFTSRPALRFVLRILTGMSQSHTSTQVLISRECIPVLHGLEQVSSDSRVGTLAENLLEAIKQHPAVAEKIEMVRKQTKEEKKRLAMAVRERQLGALGMKANERGQVIVKSKLLDQCQDLAEDTGLICNICREGYKFQPTKVLGIYTYTKRCILDEFELKSRKTYGYTTVTHFNTVHVDCHLSAVRSARSRDEWDSAALQNANTRCNGLLPIWGPQVPQSAYANALSRHNSYLQDSTGYRDIGYHSTVHDIRLQVLRFAQERSFSEDTGGGGPQSNLHLLPYMMQTALYVINSTKAATREYKRTLNYLELSPSEVIENCYDVDSAYYWITLALLVMPPAAWRKKRLQFLQRLLVCNHVRRVSIKPPAPMSDSRPRAYAYYKSALIFFAIIDSFYQIVLKEAAAVAAIVDERRTTPSHQDWSATLADYLKSNDQTVNDNIEVLLSLYQSSLVNCSSFELFFELVRLEEVSQPLEFLANTLESV